MSAASELVCFDIQECYAQRARCHRNRNDNEAMSPWTIGRVPPAATMAEAAQAPRFRTILQATAVRKENRGSLWKLP